MTMRALINDILGCFGGTAVQGFCFVAGGPLCKGLPRVSS